MSWGACRGDVALEAVLHAPDGASRDAGDYRKCRTDAPEGVTYRTDAPLADERWRRAAPDPRHPRLVVTLTPVGPSRCSGPRSGADLRERPR